MKCACVIVTAGRRPDELRAAVRSAREQTVEPETVVVVDGGAPDVAVDGVRVVRLDEQTGPPGARNRGVAETTGELIFFLDDDAAFSSPGVVGAAVARFEREPKLGIVSFRVSDPTGRPHQRRHVPRLRAGDPARSSKVTTFLEGACAIRRSVFEQTGGYHAGFFFGHEGTDLAWRAIDAGWDVAYDGDIVIHHPAEPPTRHHGFHQMTARNRVFLARRRLPWPIAAIYVMTWFLLDVARAGTPGGRVETLRGYRAGLLEPCGPRRPISWRTVWRMTLAGRPPVI